ncbi:DUF429 domain-containing protein [Corticibacterium sp. UT-5YL-CI-8]|nr:DUF429 domain-containing protein [Tianweitania sp. UT-5YL-CI-8]
MTAAGVDGCKAGWVAVTRSASDAAAEAVVHASFSALLASLPGDAVIAVDMPIGLPAFSARGGRGPEALVRPLLGQRQSSVFSIPARAAVYADTAPFTDLEAWYAGHTKASAVALGLSDPPRGVSIQAYGIFSKIREIDALLIERPDLRTRVIESHPEVAFWRLNDEKAMALPKKGKGRINPPGMEERRELLERCGYDASFLRAKPPRGARDDDFLDACAMLLIAERHRRGETQSFPSPPGGDAHGIPVAIWV